MSFKAGDLVMVVNLTDHPFVKNGMVGTVEQFCLVCSALMLTVAYHVEIGGVTMSIPERNLRKIDDDGRRVVEWDWRRELLGETA